ncbi:hypothetical protein RIF29_18031 [Crotalaria pallida]|uniref:pectinesterase n=1 Tax=Crotalaria pallida TaxID=3830 RepID=A0AAN9FP39_CROPI
MVQLPPLLALLFSLILFFNCSFWVGKAMGNCGGKINKTIVVDQSGKGEFTSVQAAIDSIMQDNNQWIKIHVTAGTYREKVEISLYKPCIILEGAGKEVTKITYGGHQSDGNWNAAFVSSPPNVIVIGITFENTFRNSADSHFTEAPAAAIFGDKSVFFNSGFIGFQDTLLDSNGRHYFKNCYIQGEVDFIYGQGQSYYQDCKINATQENSPPGFITAQRRQSEKDPSGFVFSGCSVEGSGKVKLGRAYGPYSRVIFLETYLSSVVSPEGWDPWNFRGFEYRFTYAEVNCTGPGSDTKNRVKWEKKLSPSELNEFSLSSFINHDEWLSRLPPPVTFV